MKSLNRVFLMGHVGHDPELKMSKAGKPYARLSVATNRSWMNKDDEREEKTDWHSVFIWGTLAERCCQHLRKGALVFVEGTLSYWSVAMVDQKEYKNAIQANEVKFLNSTKALSSANGEGLDNEEPSRNHNAVAHPA